MKLENILLNRNWREAQFIEDEDGYVVCDETEGHARENVRKFVTIDGELYHFVRVPQPLHRRLYFDFIAWAKTRARALEKAKYGL